MGDPPESVVAIDDVVGDRNDVVAAATEEVHDLSKGENPVGVGGVNVKVAEQHVEFSLGFSASDKNSCRPWRKLRDELL
jgi:hypothetical protein